ncbi:toxin [Streptomyces sp. Tue 6075]|uniref:DUF397 domain-containing protein n=1 Tax=Streptomyces sp. Tue 6075 TaxID=1661694 RepID=UPI00094A3306|nr:DUF397 domain-containing protein [Streptomyces sp. Tue 6075]APS23785.1 toxin [Streptomyces sp. Tue 6075]
MGYGEDLVSCYSDYSSYRSHDGPECVEVAAAPSAVRVRDSKDLAQPPLGFTPAAWADFLPYASGR